ncbi:hypothetical protein JCM30760_20450 [Thiomicrorhabdus hydrogeniphila]
MGFNLKKQNGFTLLELSIALMIMAALSYTLTLGVGATRDYDKFTENYEYLQKVRSALLTYVQTNGFLPCPDASTTVPDGVEDRVGNKCGLDAGYLPYKMLGVDAVDAWGQPLFYGINTNTNTADVDDVSKSAAYFNIAGSPAFTKDTLPIGLTSGVGNLKICGESATSCSATTPTANLIEGQAIAVVVSYGKNGAETWGSAVLDAKEGENRGNNNYFWQSRGSDVAGDAFDDQLVWLTGFDVKYALLISERGLQ